MSFVTPPWNQYQEEWQFDTFFTGYYVVSALTTEGTMKLTFDKTSTGRDSGLNASEPTLTYLEYEIYFNKEGGHNVLIPGSSVPIPSSIIRSPGWNYVKITNRVVVNGQDIGAGNPQKIDCWLITNTTTVPDYVYIDYVAIQRAGDVVGGGTVNLGNVTGVLSVQHGGTAVTISTGRSAAVLNVEPVLKNVTLEGDLTTLSNTLTIHGNVYTDFLHANLVGAYGVPIGNTVGVLPRWRETDPHRTGTGNTLVANIDPIISNSLTVLGDIYSSNIIGNVSLTYANGLLPVSAGGTGTTFKTGTGAVVLNTNAVFKGTTTMANVLANFTGNAVGLHTLNVSNATVGVLAVEHGGTGVTTKTGTGNVVLSDTPVLNNVTVSGALTGNVFGNIFGQSAVFNTLTAPTITSETLFANTSVKTSQLYGNLLGQTAIVDQSITTPTLTVSNNADILGNLSVFGNLIVASGNVVYVDSEIRTSEQIIVDNAGDGAALIVKQSGAQPIMEAQDDGNVVFKIYDEGSVAFASGLDASLNTLTAAPTGALVSVLGNVSVSQSIDTPHVYGNISGQTAVMDFFVGDGWQLSNILPANVVGLVQTLEASNANILTLSSNVDTLSANTDALSSYVRSNVDTLSSNVDTLSSNVDTLSSNVDTLSSNVDTLSSNVDTLSANTDALSSYVRSNIDTLSSNVDTLSSNVDTLSSNVDTLSANTDALSSYVRSNIDTLSSNVDTLSSNVDTLSSNVDTLSSNVDTLSSNVNTLSANTDALSSYVRSNIDTLSSNVDTLSSNVDTLSSNVGTLSSNVNTLSTNVDTLSTNVDTLSTNVDTLSTTVQGYTDTFTTGNLYATVLADLPTTIADSLTVRGNTRLQGNLIIDSGNVVYVDSQVEISEQLVVHNQGTGPAVDVLQTGAESLARFVDDGNVVMQMYNWGNVAFAHGSSTLLNNTTQSPSDALVTVFGSFAADSLRGNLAISNVVGLDTSLSDLWANAGDQQSELISVWANAGEQQTELTNLWANAGEQQAQIIALEGNAVDQQAQITALESNAVDQQTQITSLEGNAVDQQAQITALESNAVDQQAQITSLEGNAVDQQAQITALESNAGEQQTQINIVQTDLANVFIELATETITANIITANAFIGDGSQLTNVGSSNASLLTEGTLSQDRLPTTIGNAQTSFIGDGSQLTNVGSSNASLLTEGTLSQDRLPTTIGNAQTSFIGDGSQLTNVGSSNASLLTEGTLSQDRFPTTIGNEETVFIGNGALLTGIESVVDNLNVSTVTANVYYGDGGLLSNVSILTSGYVEEDFDVLGNLTGNLVLANTDGTEAAPSYAFRSELDLGMYRASANTLGIAAGGTEVAQISTDGLLVNGNVSATYLLGNGALLEGVASSNASSLTEGVISQSVLPQTLGNTLTSFVGNGYYLESLNAAALSGNIDADVVLDGNVDGEIILEGEIDASVLIVGGNLSIGVPILLENGSASEPMLSFNHATTTGVYLETGNLGISANGSGVLTVTPTALVPQSNSVYDLGSSTNSFGSLYLSGNTLYLGNVVLKDEDGSLSTSAQLVGDGSGLSNLTAANINGLTQALDIIQASSVDANVANVGNISIGNVVSNILIDGEVTTTGNVFAGGNITAFASDKRLKSNIQPIQNAVELIKKLHGYTFTWRDDIPGLPMRGDDIGLLAQELQDLGLDQCVSPAPFDLDQLGHSRSGEQYLTIHYNKLFAVVIQALHDIIDAMAL